MRIRILSVVITLALLICLLPVNTMAAQDDSNTVYYGDGSYLMISIEDISPRAANTRVAYKYYRYYDSDDNLEWEARLDASYTYDGTTSSCISASCTVTVYDSKWYEYSNSTTFSGDTATTELVMGQKFMGITIAKREYTITLTCDKDGNLS